MITVYFDGACWPHNPGGHIGWGYLIYEIRQNKPVWLHEDCGYQPAGETSNNLAEYLAVYHALAYLIANDLHRKKILVSGDSKLVIKQLKGQWRINQGVYTYVADRAKALLSQFDQIKFKWIPRNCNNQADLLTSYGLAKGGLLWRLNNHSEAQRTYKPRIEIAVPNHKKYSQCLNQLHLLPTVEPVNG